MNDAPHGDQQKKRGNTMNSEWEYPDNADTFLDPLLTSLSIMAKLHGRPMTPESLTVGLPLEENALTVSLYFRAAERVGFSSRIAKRSLSELNNVVCPCILLLENRRCCVLTAIDHEKKRAEIIVPEASEGRGLDDGGQTVGSEIVSLEKLNTVFEGHVLFSKPEFQFEKRTEAGLFLEGEHWFWGTILLSWRIYRDVFLATILINLFVLVSPFFVRNVYNRVVPNNAIETMWWLAFGACLAFSFDIVLRIVRTYFLDLAGKKSDLILSARLFGQALGMRFEGRPQSVGTFAKNIQEFEVVRDFVTSASLGAVVDLPFALLFLAVIGIMSGPLVWVPVGAIVVILVSGLFFHPVMKSAVVKSSRASSQKNGLLVESLHGLESVKATGAEGQLQRKWEEAVSFIAQCNMKSRLISSTAGSVGTYANQLSTIILLIYGVYLIKDGELNMGSLIAAMMLNSRAIVPFVRLANIATRYTSARAAYASLKTVMELEQERPSDKKFIYHPSFEGRVVFDQVDFNYPGSEHLALAGVSFSFNSRNHVGIIGKIGSGKSTIARLLIGLYRPIKGVIEIDGINLNQLDPAALRRHVGLVTQDQVLFYGTIRENIVMGVPHVDDHVLNRAATLAGVMDFAVHQPDGLDMNVGEQGRALSGGQRQCVLLARALLLDPPILLLDEPTSSMDNSSEQAFIKRLKTIVGKKTLILVTHKASLLTLVDQLIVMDHGQIVVQGPKDTVIRQLQEENVSEGQKSHA
ncbi:type I secretion system permease/ATPase [Pseudodesulfovibrio sp. JC047]|uniref:type I secretion system permease/ATPase n=1 Tax=Pseudodesulfovibrio sp. JC047 TaxID=2683199 RepID=UPI0013D693BC|nr:type I secretion system permease/ATPase [Pseudodesulfovibrio sp. JC047]NDV19281.1 type I secretion system permease/ATPase [Pseudodesulfovibrio sp. JC047]